MEKGFIVLLDHVKMYANTHHFSDTHAEQWMNTGIVPSFMSPSD